MMILGFSRELCATNILIFTNFTSLTLFLDEMVFLIKINDSTLYFYRSFENRHDLNTLLRNYHVPTYFNGKDGSPRRRESTSAL